MRTDDINITSLNNDKKINEKLDRENYLVSIELNLSDINTKDEKCIKKYTHCFL